MKHPNYVLLYVEDPARSAAFYQDLLACPPIEAQPEFALFALSSGMMIGLWARRMVVPAADAAPGAAEIGFRVESYAEVDAAFAEWKRRAVPIVQEPIELDFGRSFVAVDPDGHRLRVYCLAPGA